MNLIPFGKDKTTGRLLDVAEVLKGEQCGCICPSCGTQLVARQGTIKEWHFAHKKDYHKGTHGPCKYSWFVALRMMIRQILSEENVLFLPEYSKYHPLKEQNISVTQAQTLRYEQCAIDKFEKREHHSFDAKLFVQQHPLHVFISYKGREYRGFRHDQHLEGIIEIDLRHLVLRRQKQLTEKSCVAQLRHMLKNHHPCKRWIYHKREIAIVETIQRDIAEQKKQRAKKQHSFSKNKFEHGRYVIEQSIPAKDNRHVSMPQTSAVVKAKRPKPEPVKDQPFYCILCKHEYMGTKEGRNPCPLCNEHLYRRAL